MQMFKHIVMKENWTSSRGFSHICTVAHICVTRYTVNM